MSPKLQTNERFFPFTHVKCWPHNSYAIITASLIHAGKSGKGASWYAAASLVNSFHHCPTRPSSHILLYLSLHISIGHLHIQLMSLLYICLQNLKQVTEIFHKLPSPHLLTCQLWLNIFLKLPLVHNICLFHPPENTVLCLLLFLISK